jgi:hypothetical protein
MRKHNDTDERGLLFLFSQSTPFLYHHHHHQPTAGYQITTAATIGARCALRSALLPDLRLVPLLSSTAISGTESGRSISSTLTSVSGLEGHNYTVS